MVNLKKTFSLAALASTIISFAPCAYAMDLSEEQKKARGSANPPFVQEEKKDLPKKVYSFPKGQPLMTVYSGSINFTDTHFEKSGYSYVPSKENMTFDEFFEELSQQYLKKCSYFCMGRTKVTELTIWDAKLKDYATLNDSNFSKYLETDCFKNNKVLIILDPFSHSRYKKD